MGVSAYRRGRMVRRMIDHADRWVIKRRATRVADRMAEQKADSTPREDADTPTRRYVSAPRRYALSGVERRFGDLWASLLQLADRGYGTPNLIA